MSERADAGAVGDGPGARGVDPGAVRLEHVALWTRDLAGLERLRAFYATHFGARAGTRYHSARQAGFASYFLTFAGGARLELMTLPSDGAPPDHGGDAASAGASASSTPARPARPVPGYAHVALSVGSPEAVDACAARLAAAGVPIVAPARWTGDGYYEVVVADPDGNLVEITA